MAQTPDEKLISAGIKLGRSRGVLVITRDDVAEEADVASGLVGYYFGTMEEFRASVIRHAVQLQVLPIIRDAIAVRHPEVANIDATLRRRALAS